MLTNLEIRQQKVDYISCFVIIKWFKTRIRHCQQIGLTCWSPAHCYTVAVLWDVSPAYAALRPIYESSFWYQRRNTKRLTIQSCLDFLQPIKIVVMAKLDIHAILDLKEHRLWRFVCTSRVYEYFKKWCRYCGAWIWQWDVSYTYIVPWVEKIRIPRAGCRAELMYQPHHFNMSTNLETRQQQICIR